MSRVLLFDGTGAVGLLAGLFRIGRGGAQAARRRVRAKQAAAEALAGVSAPALHAGAARRTATRSATRKRGATHPRRGRPKGSGTRGVEALELVKANPGITIPQIAEKMGIKQNYLYRVLPGLAEDGLVVKDGRGWKPKQRA